MNCNKPQEEVNLKRPYWDAYKESNIHELAKVICEDEYDDSVQYVGVSEIYPKPLIEFCRRNFLSSDDSYSLEIGCGSGGLLNILPISNGYEPNLKRYKLASERFSDETNIELGFAENLKFQKEWFSNVLFLNGIFQVRSLAETLIEINRVLEKSGRLIFNTYSDNVDVVCGLTYGPKNLIRYVKEFGFDLIEFREMVQEDSSRFQDDIIIYGFCFEKIETFNPDNLKKLQLVKDVNGLYKANNYFPDGRDWRLQ